MTQKTFKTIENFEVGEQVLLYSKTREVKKVTPAGEDDIGRPIFSVTVGKDLHEEWE